MAEQSSRAQIGKISKKELSYLGNKLPSIKYTWNIEPQLTVHTVLLRVDPADNLPPVIYQLAFSHSVAYPSSWLVRSLEAQSLALEHNKPNVADKSSWLIHLVNQVCFDLAAKSVRVELTEEAYHEPIHIALSDDSFEKVSSIVRDVQDACALAREEQEQAHEFKNRSLELSRSSSRSSTDSNQSNNFIASVFSIFSSGRSDASISPPPSPSPSNESGKINNTQSPSRVLRSRARAKLADAFRRYVLPALKAQLVGVAEELPDGRSNVDYYEFLAQAKITAHEREVAKCIVEGKLIQHQIETIGDNSHRSRKGALAVLQESLISNNQAPSLRQLKAQADALNKRRVKLENKTMSLKSTLENLQQYTAKREAISKEHAAELEAASLRRNGLLMASQVAPKPTSFAPRRSSPLKEVLVG
ncbi:hypothetical protein E3Q17_02725 [Wallemia mellicola]|uniref:Uncharacterized protein n=1 Tax=Wallemia mellicola TaxID=1708541 RepID=A0A4T0NP80_9BASI|nr:hypothetical protein E3Q17_02725 [Wallemia mellicola]